MVPLRLTPVRGLFINHPDLIDDVLVTHNRSFVESLALAARACCSAMG